nr:6,7-dimethyl-8-ribityllumazine synthase [Ipomoea batatas]
MGNSLRCCLACVIPCGALDLIRIVHLNGQVEEIAHPITAGEVVNNNPNHVLSKPSSSQGMVRRIMILSPESELKRGMYNVNAAARNVVSPSEKKSPCRRHRRRSGKVGIWRPHLESISEDY